MGIDPEKEFNWISVATSAFVGATMRFVQAYNMPFKQKAINAAFRNLRKEDQATLLGQYQEALQHLEEGKNLDNLKFMNDLCDDMIKTLGKE